jgi:hypothetical protein
MRKWATSTARHRRVKTRWSLLRRIGGGDPFEEVHPAAPRSRDGRGSEWMAIRRDVIAGTLGCGALALVEVATGRGWVTRHPQVIRDAVPGQGKGNVQE